MRDRLVEENHSDQITLLKLDAIPYREYQLFLQIALSERDHETASALFDQK